MTPPLLRKVTTFNNINQKNDIREIVCLLNELFNGEKMPNDFRIDIQKYSINKVITLLRDQLPNFSKDIKEKICNVFISQFYTKQPFSQKNALWAFTDSRSFWQLIKVIHDEPTSRKLRFHELVQIIAEEINKKIHFSTIEEKILLQLEKNPTIKYKNLANYFSLSQKSITMNVKNLKGKGIVLGSMIDYSSLNIKEFFIFQDIGDTLKLEHPFPISVEVFSLFPNKKVIYLQIDEDLSNTNFAFRVITKKHITNMYIFVKKLSGQILKSKAITYPKIITTVKPSSIPEGIRHIKREYVIELLKNCENDYRHPGFSGITKKYNVSIRTLLRIKSKLLQHNIIQPCIKLESDRLLQILVLSTNELEKVYRLIPQADVFEITNTNGAKYWLSVITIFASDLKFFLNELNEIRSCFLITNKKKVFNNRGISLFL